VRPARPRRSLDRLSIESYPSRAAMGAAAASAIATELRRRLATSPEVRIIFAAAPSQAEMLEALCAAEQIDWTRIVAFHMDEYIGLRPAAPERFAVWLDYLLFDRLPFKAVYRIVPEPDPEAAARIYAKSLAAAPIDLVCLGIGVNGHIAFNDPPIADFKDPLDVKVVELDETCRQQQVDDNCFPSLAEVPRTAITLTIPRLLRAEKLFCVVPGRAKREAVRQTLYGPLSTLCPASILRRFNCTLYLDSESDPDVTED
jgi:glucosamine-6-phosphate deaminase